MTSLVLLCAPTITSRPSGICIINYYKLSVWRVFKYQAGGEGEEVCLTESAIERFRSIAIVGVESFISGWRGGG